MTRTPRVVVVGLGAWGSNALWRLAERGVEALGLDLHRPPHPSGSSVGTTRMYRTTCLEHSDLVPMARHSIGLWQRLGALAGRSFLDGSGALLLGPPSSRLVRESRRVALEHDIPVDALDAAAVRARYPAHAGLPDDHVGILEPGAGLVDAPAAILAALARARALGAAVMTGAEVTAIDTGTRRPTVHTTAGRFRADHVVVAAGGWSNALLADRPLAQQNVRMPMTWVFADGRPELEIARFPVFLRHLTDSTILWGHGARPGDPSDRVKLGIEDPGGPDAFEVGSPDELDRTLSAEDVAPLVTRVARAVEGTAPRVADAIVAQFARTADGQFLLGPLDDERHVIVATGCNAHGFKHAPAVGDVIADLLTTAQPRLQISAFDPRRFERDG